MAEAGDDVYISGSDYGPWASEVTAIKMSEAIADLVDITKKQQTDIVNQLKKNGKVTEKTAKALGRAGGLKSSLAKDLRKAGDSAVDMAGGFNKLNKGPLKNFGVALKNSSKSLKVGLAAFGLIGQSLGMFISIVRDSTAAMRDMADVGITIPGGIHEMQQSMATVGMTLGELGELSAKYAQVISGNGLKAITDLTKSVNAADGGFMKYGLTTAEATEFTAEYLEQQRLGGVYSRASDKRQAVEVQKNIERLTAYSKILNVSRKDLMDNRKEVLTNADVQAQLAMKSEAEREKATRGLQAISDATGAYGASMDFLKVAITDFAGHQQNVLAASFGEIAGAGFADVAYELAAFGDAAMLGKEATAEQIKQLVMSTTADKTRMQAMINAEGESKIFATKLLSARKAILDSEALEKKNRLAYAQKLKSGFEGSYDDFLKTVPDSVATAAGLDDALNILKARGIAELTSTFITLIGEEGQAGVKGAITGINKLSDGMAKYGAEFRGWIKMVKESDNPFTEIMKSVGGGFLKLLEAIGNLIVKAIEEGFQKLIDGTVLGHQKKAWAHDIDVISRWLDDEDANKDFASGQAAIDTVYAALSPEDKIIKDEHRAKVRAETAARLKAEELGRTTTTTTTKEGAPTVTSPSSAVGEVSKGEALIIESLQSLKTAVNKTTQATKTLSADGPM